jgi:hypothetical protein
MSIVNSLTSSHLLLSDNGPSLDCLSLTNSRNSQTEPNLIIWFFNSGQLAKSLLNNLLVRILTNCQPYNASVIIVILFVRILHLPSSLYAHQHKLSWSIAVKPWSVALFGPIMVNIIHRCW